MASQEVEFLQEEENDGESASDQPADSEADSERQRQLLAKLPEKEGPALTKPEMQLIARIEGKLGRNFLFCSDKFTKSGNQTFFRLHYSLRGDKAAALATGQCKFIKCSKCNDLLYFEGSHLAKHAKLHDSLEAPDAKRKSEDIQSFVSHPLSVTEKGELATMFAQYAINGDASFRSMSMPAFNKLATTLINFGVRRKKQVQDAQLVDRRTIARHATALADNTFKELAGTVARLKENGAALAVDYGRRLDDYICIVAHFIEARATEWKLRSVPIGFSACVESKTSAQVWLDILDALEPLDFTEDDIIRCIGVSDEGSNVSNALSDNLESAVKCVCHVLNTIMKRIFELYVEVQESGKLTAQEMAYVSKGQKVLSYCASIANSVRNIPKVANELSKKPNKWVLTRFLTRLDTARDVQTILDELVNLRRDREFQCRLGPTLCEQIVKLNGYRNELSDCIEVLALFENPMDMLESEKHPTIHCVWAEILKLRHSAKKIMKNVDKSQFIRALAKSCVVAIDHKLEDGFITVTHKVAAFLDPRIRHMSHLSNEERAELHDTVRNMISRYPLTLRSQTQSQVDASVSNDESDSESELIVQRRDQPPVIDEVDSYQRDSFAETSSSVFDILAFWHAHEERYPRLSKLALRILAIPASSASCERAFRRVKLLVTESRESLTPETVTKMMLSKGLI